MSNPENINFDFIDDDKSKSNMSFEKNDNNSLEIKIKNYIKINNPCVYILTPCYGGMCHLNYLCSLMKTIDIFKLYN